MEGMERFPALAAMTGISGGNVPGGYIAAKTTTAEAEKPGAVPAQIAVLLNLLDQQAELLADLKRRIEPVLSSGDAIKVTATGTATSDISSPGSSKISAQLTDLACRAVYNNSLIFDLFSRVEV